MPKLDSFFTTIHQYKIPIHHWVEHTPYSSGTKDGWENEIYQWCRDNLQSGWELVNRFDHGWIVNVTDNTDYDLLILTWGK